MQLNQAISRFQIEPLEQRRMLCGNLGDAHSDSLNDQPAGAAAGSEMVAAAADDSGGNAIAAFAKRNHGARLVMGEFTVINGAHVVTWAVLSPQDDQILAVGVTVPMKLIENQPQQPGNGPAGAIASLQFPAVVRNTTFFNHLEMHTQPNGHGFLPFAAQPNRYLVPHFDFHFYSIDEAQVRTIPAGPPVPPAAADLLPAGYRQPGPSELQMGRHSGPLSEATATDEWRAVMVAGFKPDGSQMHFAEPMITQAKLLEQQDFSLPMPMPSRFGRQTLYPTRFDAKFQGNAYHLVFSDFIQTDPTSSVASSAAATQTAPVAFSPPPSAPVGIGLTTADATEENSLEALLA